MIKDTYIHNLTPIRGIAALLVVVYHVNIMLQGALLGGGTSSIISQLYLMVDLFFMISGFVICHAYGSWFNEGISSKRFAQFVVARFARIYPLYLFALLALVIIVFSYHLNIGVTPSMFKNNFDFQDVPVNLMLLQSMNTLDYLGWNLPSWSVSVEWWVYMIFPVLVFLYTKYMCNTFNVVCLILCVIGYLLISLNVYNLNPQIVSGVWPKRYNSIDITYHFGIFRCFLGFFIGMIVYQYFIINKLKNALSKSYVMLALVFLLISSLHFAIPDYITVWLFPFIILCAAYGEKGVNQLLNISFLKNLGEWSYSIYLIHIPILYFFVLFLLFVPEGQYSLPSSNQPIAAWVICYAFVSITLLVAYLTYRFIEMPARKKIKEMAAI